MVSDSQEKSYCPVVSNLTRVEYLMGFPMSKERYSAVCILRRGDILTLMVGKNAFSENLRKKRTQPIVRLSNMRSNMRGDLLEVKVKELA